MTLRSLSVACLAMVVGACSADAPSMAGPEAPLVGSSSAASYPAPPSGWEDVYDPLVLRSFNVRLTAANYATIQADETFDIQVPATFWLDGDTSGPYTVTIRRKSATPIGEKISYRMRFRAPTPLFYGIQSFSLENGDDQDVVSEGLSWYLHRLASTPAYRPGLAAWATLTMHVEDVDANGDPVVDVRPQGVYLNVELPDKQFLRNRGLWQGSSTWLYKQDDIGLPELKENPDGSTSSPTYDELDYSPFRVAKGKNPTNPTPSDAVLAGHMARLVDMDSWLRLGAVNAYTSNPDELFNKGKNFFWVDFMIWKTARPVAPLRLYLPWDLDASIRGTTAGIYGTTGSGKGGKGSVAQHPYQEVILNHPTYRAQYNTIFTDLLDGPMATDALQQALTRFEGVLSDALAADPNSQIDDVPYHFDKLRAWVAAREVNVRSQVQANNSPAPRN
jgi:hypothetical protein